MPTLADIKTRVITETNRDDLTTDLASTLSDTINRAIAYYGQERWWFNEQRYTSTITAGSQYLDIPAGIGFIDQLFLVIGNIRYNLIPQTPEHIESLYSTPITGQPTDYAVFLTQVRFWPTPPTAWQIVWYGLQDYTLSSDSDSNYWTNQGQDLIVARTEYLLYRDVFKGDPRLQTAEMAMNEAYQRLKAETTRRLSNQRMRPSQL